MLDEKVSVIIPMYNSSKHIEELSRFYREWNMSLKTNNKAVSKRWWWITKILRRAKCRKIYKRAIFI